MFAARILTRFLVPGVVFTFWRHFGRFGLAFWVFSLLFGGEFSLAAFSLLPQSSREAAQKPELERLASQWLEAIAERASVWPGGVHEASEAALFEAIAELADYYGFAFERYPLRDSFSFNLEILLPALPQNAELSQKSLAARPSSLANREIVLVTPVSGIAGPDIVTLLLFMALWETGGSQAAQNSKAAPLDGPVRGALPVRLAFLGSELPPPEISPFSSPRYRAAGSRGFLEHYPDARPYSLIYLFHGREPLPPIVPASQRLRSFAAYFGQNLQRFWARYRNEIPVRPLFDSRFLGGSYRIIYGGSLRPGPLIGSEPAGVVSALGAALDTHFGDVGLPYFFTLRGDPSFFAQPYLEEQWPFGAVYQFAGAPLVLAQSLRQFVRLEQQRAKTDTKGETTADTHKNVANARQTGASGSAEDGMNYRLGKAPVWGTWLVAERELLWLFLSAIALFAVCSFCSRLYWAWLRAHKFALQAIANTGLVVFFVMGCLFLAAIPAQFALRFVAERLPTLPVLFERVPPFGAALDYWFVLLSLSRAVLQLWGALLLLYCGAFAVDLWQRNPAGGSLALRAAKSGLILYLARLLSFALSFWLFWQSPHLVLFGLYAFFLVLLYSVFDAVFVAVRPPLRWAMNWLRRMIRWLIFVPYFLLALPPENSWAALPDRPIYGQHYLLFWLCAVPGLLLHARQIQLHRAFVRALYAPFYPGIYRRYLLGRVLAFAVGLSLCIGTVYLLYTEEKGALQGGLDRMTDGPNEAAAPQGLPALRIEESYAIAGEAKILRLYFVPFATGFWAKTLRQLEIRDRGAVLDLSEFRRIKPQMEILPDFSAGDFWEWQRELSDDELSQLGELGQKLLRADNRVLRRRYSSEVWLQSRSPLTRLRINTEGPKLLFANFPFSVPSSVPRRSGYWVSSLALGLYPVPEDWAWNPGETDPKGKKNGLKPLYINLLFDQPSAWLRYDIEFLLPDTAQQDAFLQQRDPLAEAIFPSSIHLRMRNLSVKTAAGLMREPQTTERSGNRHGNRASRRLEPQQDYLHIVRINGLKKRLDSTKP